MVHAFPGPRPTDWLRRSSAAGQTSYSGRDCGCTGSGQGIVRRWQGGWRPALTPREPHAAREADSQNKQPETSHHGNHGSGKYAAFLASLGVLPGSLNVLGAANAVGRGREAEPVTHFAARGGDLSGEAHTAFACPAAPSCIHRMLCGISVQDVEQGAGEL